MFELFRMNIFTIQISWNKMRWWSGPKCVKKVNVWNLHLPEIWSFVRSVFSFKVSEIQTKLSGFQTFHRSILKNSDFRHIPTKLCLKTKLFVLISSNVWNWNCHGNQKVWFSDVMSEIWTQISVILCVLKPNTVSVWNRTNPYFGHQASIRFSNCPDFEHFD